MDPDDFLSVVMSGHNVSEFARQIATGAAWEIAAQATINGALGSVGATGREIRYPASHEAVDIAFVKDGRLYLVELKVEKAGNQSGARTPVAEDRVVAALESDRRIRGNVRFASKSLPEAFELDRSKLAGFDLPGFVAGSGMEPGRKWVLFLAYSAEAKRQLFELQKFTRIVTSGPISAALAGT